jgi:hypothetical protein
LGLTEIRKQSVTVQMIISCVDAVPQKSVAADISVKNNKVFFTRRKISLLRGSRVIILTDNNMGRNKNIWV